MKKRIFAITMVLIMVLTACVGAYADTVVEPRDTNHVSYYTERTGRQTADVTIYAYFSGEAELCSMYVYLQQKVNGVWTDLTTSDEYFYYVNGTNTSLLTFAHNYTTLAEGGIYRIKCVTRDFMNSSEGSATSYSNQF